MTNEQFANLHVGQTIHNIVGVAHIVAERINYRDGKIGYILRSLDGDRAYAGTPDRWTLTEQDKA